MKNEMPRRTRPIRAAAIAAALVLAACGSDRSTEGTTPPTARDTTEDTTRDTTDDTTGDTTGDTTEDTTPGSAPSTDGQTTQTTCLSDPIASSDDRPRVGEIEQQKNDRVEVDCEEVFGGEAILEQAVIASDPSGVAEFGIDGSAECILRPDSAVQITPEPQLLLAVSAGELLCHVEDGETRSVVAGDGIPVRLETAMFSLEVDDDGSGSATVFEGYLIIEPPGAECQVLVGPRQRVDLAIGPLPDVVALDPRILPPPIRETIVDLGGTVEPPSVPPALLPGLAERLDLGQLTVAVDGEIVGSADADGADDVLVLERIIGRAVLLDDAVVGRIDVGSPIAPIEVRAPDIVLPVAPIDPGPIAVIDELVVAEAIGEPIDDVVEIPILIEPNGSRWTVALDADDTDLRRSLTDELRTLVDSGAYAAYYEAAFEATPNYGPLRPDLLDLDPC